MKLFLQYLALLLVTNQESQSTDTQILLYRLHFDPLEEKTFLQLHPGKYHGDFFQQKIEALLEQPLSEYEELTPNEQEEIFNLIHSYKNLLTITYGKIPFIIVNTIFFMIIYERSSFFHISSLKTLNQQVHNLLFVFTVLRTTVLLKHTRIIEIIMNFYKIDHFGDILEVEFQKKLTEEVNKKQVTLNNTSISLEEIIKYYDKEYLLEIFKSNPTLKTTINNDYQLSEEEKIIDALCAKWSDIDRSRSVLRVLSFCAPLLFFKYQKYPTLMNIYKNNRIILLAIIGHLLLSVYYKLHIIVLSIELSKILLQTIILNVYWLIKYNRYEYKLLKFVKLIKENGCIFDQDHMAYVINESGNSPESVNQTTNRSIIKLIVM